MRYIFLFTTLFLIACDPCEDCDIVSFEPTMTLVFINQDSLNALDTLLAEVDTSQTELTEHKLSLDSALKDSIARLEAIDTLFSGSELEEVRARLENDTANINQEIEEVNADIDSVDMLENAYDSLSSRIQSGWVVIEEMVNKNISSILYSQDTANSFEIPLSYLDARITYDVTIADSTRSAIFDIYLDTIFDIERNILIGADSIALQEAPGFLTYDSCNSNCEDGSAIFTLYF